jgi:hypothetical protein
MAQYTTSSRPPQIICHRAVPRGSCTRGIATRVTPTRTPSTIMAAPTIMGNVSSPTTAPATIVSRSA